MPTRKRHRKKRDIDDRSFRKSRKQTSKKKR